VNNFIPFTQEMIDASVMQASKRNPHIKHHFESATMDGEIRDQVGFLGEFACCEALGLSWQENIRSSYSVPDNCDILFSGKKIDVKTSIAPERFVPPNHTRGFLMVAEAQREHVLKSDYIVSGIIDKEKMNGWYPVGFAPTSIINGIKPVTHHSVSGTKYVTPTIEINYSKLQTVEVLMGEYGTVEGAEGERISRRYEEVIEDAEKFIETNYDEPHEDLREAARIIKSLLEFA
jgi:hypothetical protein